MEEEWHRRQLELVEYVKVDVFHGVPVKVAKCPTHQYGLYKYFIQIDEIGAEDIVADKGQASPTRTDKHRPMGKQQNMACLHGPPDCGFCRHCIKKRQNNGGDLPLSVTIDEHADVSIEFVEDSGAGDQNKTLTRKLSGKMLEEMKKA